MKLRVLIMGLPGAGKTTLAQAIVSNLTDCLWLNADAVRTEYNDWDFSEDGRIRQSVRMRNLADAAEQQIVIVDMIAPMPEQRDIFKADITIWVDTIIESRYEDTNRAFTKPISPTFRVVTQDSVKWAEIISKYIIELQISR